ncbi:MAG: bifunctional folylpolyglutamate synthase/dihydrofolate synthase [Lachnospiraceae bacterium]
MPENRYQDIVGRIESAKRFGSTPGIEVSKKLLAAVGHPEKDLQFIHIAGTNGKGSTAAFLCSILNISGISNGLFTSPHLIDFSERIRVNGEMIDQESVIRIGERLLSIELNVRPTMFDLCFVMSLLYFKETKCRIVILETGIGGRLDSTNSITEPMICLMTKIGLDHVDILGNDLVSIAKEKAAIIKENALVVSVCQSPKVMEVIRERCNHLNAELWIADQLYQDEIGISGEYQKENAAAAKLSAELLQKFGYKISQISIHNGIKDTYWPGRMEIISRAPFFLIDGAHNAQGATALCDSLKAMYPNETFEFIIGVMADKDYTGILEPLLPLAFTIDTVTPNNSRAMGGEQLSEYIRRKGISSHSYASVEQMLLYIKEKKSSDVRIIALGSLYFVGEIKKLLSLK